MKQFFSFKHWKKIPKIAWDAAMLFSEDKCMKMSASLAYYTIFSIGPFLLIIIWLIGFFYGEYLEDHNAQQRVLMELTEIFGQQVAVQIQSIMENMAITSNSYVGIVIGLGTLMFTSTTVFVELQDSINTIWGVKPKPKKSWLKFILNRLISFSMILGMGFLLITSLLLNSILVLLIQYVNDIIPGISNQMLGNVNTILTFVIITTTFGFIFKVLPDAKVRNQHIIIGAVMTTLLFMLGRMGISFYLQNNATATAFGTAGSLIILMLWVYYSAAIVYYGAEFTKIYAQTFDDGIHPSHFAVLVKKTEVEIDNDPQP